MLKCLNPLAIHLYSLACLLWYSPLAEYGRCSHLFIYCIYTTRIAARTWRLLLSLGVRATSQLPVEFHSEDSLLVVRFDDTIVRLSVM
jgi:hypothetical protein